MTIAGPMVSVYFYVPNMIGYVRFGLLAAFCILFSRMRTAAVLCYCISYLLDAADGLAARMLSQNSKFGETFDMVLDRGSSTALLMALLIAYPKYLPVVQGITVLDIMSHFAQKAYGMAQNKSHKEAVSSGLLYYYYTKRSFLFMECLLNEVFYLSVLCSSKSKRSRLFLYSAILSSPFAVLKVVLNVMQLYEAMKGIAEIYDKKKKD